MVLCICLVHNYDTGRYCILDRHLASLLPGLAHHKQLTTTLRLNETLCHANEGVNLERDERS